MGIIAVNRMDQLAFVHLSANSSNLTLVFRLATRHCRSLGCHDILAFAGSTSVCIGEFSWSWTDLYFAQISSLPRHGVFDLAAGRLGRSRDRTALAFWSSLICSIAECIRNRSIGTFAP